MPLRYFKCHTLPFPCYGLSATTTASSSFQLAWKNGPPGQDAIPTAHVEYATVAASTTTTVSTVSGTLESAKITGLAVIADTPYQVRLRRQNAAGYGEWTGYVTVTVTP